VPDRKTEDFHCAKCGFKEKLCVAEEGKGPPWCPTQNRERVRTAAMQKYEDPELREFARLASVQEGACCAARDAVPFVPTEETYLSLEKRKPQLDASPNIIL